MNASRSRTHCRAAAPLSAAPPGPTHSPGPDATCWSAAASAAAAPHTPSVSSGYRPSRSGRRACAPSSASTAPASSGGSAPPPGAAAAGAAESAGAHAGRWSVQSACGRAGGGTGRHPTRQGSRRRQESRPQAPQQHTPALAVPQGSRRAP
ncbi:MAG: hypothetical protein J3K34DRAFT_103693 [Monoraphidium minutum]|nr:MAG: hypothetical protein J3K34DRAFT_103693 [Monoraphidium minutum]